MPGAAVASQTIFGRMRDEVPSLAGLSKTDGYDVNEFTPCADPPDSIQGFLLPGVSPLAKKICITKTGPVGQIQLAELSRWYQEKNLEGKKHTVEEWKTTLEYIKDRANMRQTSSKDTVKSSNTNRSGVENKMKDMQKEVTSSFQAHLTELGQYISSITEVLNKVKLEIKTMTGAITSLEDWIAARTLWPVKVNRKCQFYRDQRLGIDLVTDETEIELCKEEEVLTNVVGANTSEVLDDAYNLLTLMNDVKKRLEEDLERKKASQNIDTQMNSMKPAIYLTPHLDAVQLRPESALDDEDWREVTDELIMEAGMSMSDCDDLRTKMQESTSNCDGIVAKCTQKVDAALEEKFQLSESARDEILSLLKNTKTEISNTTQEIKRLEKLIGNQHIPLSFATTRLQTRIYRPDAERTIDSVHRSLIKEVAEMDEAVATLQSELNSNLCNLQDLKILESMLEEDYGIKKVTFNLEKRCKKIRSFLRPDADNYIVTRMLNDDDFFDLLTR